MVDKPEEQAKAEVADQTTQNMADMATTLSDIQDEMAATASAPAARQFKPLWLLALIVVAVIIGGGTFLSVQRLTDVDQNTKSIAEGCQIRNEALTVINEKFYELNVLIAISVRDVNPADPQARDFLAAFETLRKPIPLMPCEEKP